MKGSNPAAMAPNMGAILSSIGHTGNMVESSGGESSGGGGPQTLPILELGANMGKAQIIDTLNSSVAPSGTLNTLFPFDSINALCSFRQQSVSSVALLSLMQLPTPTLGVPTTFMPHKGPGGQGH